MISNVWFKRVVFVVILLSAAWLRLDRLEQLPPAPYWEEVALGYDAYSLWQTGRDHHGEFLPIVALRSFGDFKPALYAYLVAPVVGWWGLSVWAVRLPAAIAGVAMVGGIYWWIAWLVEIDDTAAKATDGLGDQHRQHAVWQWWPLVGAGIAAISPWSLQFSRGGWEAQVAATFIIWGMICGVRLKRSSWWLVPTVVLLILATYTYHAARLVAPLLGVALIGWWWLQSHQFRWWHQLRQQWLGFLVASGVALVMIWPLAHAFISQDIRVTQRIAETSLGYDQALIVKSNDRRQQDPTWLHRLLYHRHMLQAQAVAGGFFDHFRADFLFVHGDQNPRHAIQFMGQLYLIEAPLLIIGIGWMWRYRRSGGWLMVWWLVVGIIPAALTKDTPHALRILSTLPVWLTAISAGAVALVEWLSARGWWLVQRCAGLKLPSSFESVALLMSVIILVTGYGVSFAAYWRFYTRVYPVIYANEWQYGYRQAVTLIAHATKTYPDTPIWVSREYGRPAMYYWFYTATDPRLVQEAAAVVPMDQGEFLAFDQLKFIPEVTALSDAELTGGESIVASSRAGFEYARGRGWDLTSLGEVRGLDGEVIWVVYRVNN